MLASWVTLSMLLRRGVSVGLRMFSFSTEDLTLDLILPGKCPEDGLSRKYHHLFLSLWLTGGSTSVVIFMTLHWVSSMDQHADLEHCGSVCWYVRALAGSSQQEELTGPFTASTIRHMKARNIYWYSKKKKEKENHCHIILHWTGFCQSAQLGLSVTEIKNTKKTREIHLNTN